MSFTIRFEGLVCHIAPESDPHNKSHAVLIADKPTHVPTLQVNSDTPIELDEGDTITFITGAGKARAQPQFIDRVPGLKSLLPAGDTLQTKVSIAVHDPNDNALAFIIYPDGKLEAPQVSDHPLDFDDANGVFLKKHCVANEVMFVSDADATELKITNGAAVRTVALSPGDLIRIKNISSDTLGHFHLYRGLTTSNTMGAAKADTLRKCKQHHSSEQPITMLTTKEALTKEVIENARRNRDVEIEVRARTVPHAECTNSGWP